MTMTKDPLYPPSGANNQMSKPKVTVSEPEESGSTTSCTVAGAPRHHHSTNGKGPGSWSLLGRRGPSLEARQARYRQRVAYAGEYGDDDAVRDASIVVDDKAQIAGGGKNENEELGVEASIGPLAASWNMLCYAIALGVLSIPAVVANIGVVPFILINLLFAGFHYYTGIAYWQLKLRYPGVQNLEDAGDLLFGRGGRIVFGGCQLLFGIFLQGNHVLLGAKAFYTLGWTDTCAIALAVIFSIISFFFTLPRSYRLFSFFAFTSFASITIVCILVMIASNVTGPINAPPNAAPVTVHAFGPASGGTTTFISGMNSVSNLLVSYGAIPSYLPIMSEMRDARRFPRALKVLIGVELVLYTVVGGVIVRALGQYTTSPSLNSLNPLLAKISYGIALPVILIAGCASGQVSAKQLLLLVQRRLRMRRQAVYAQDQSAGGVPTMGKSSKKQIWIIWILVNVFTWTCAFILAEIIPFFGSFLSVESSLFWSTFILFAAVFHLWILREEKNSHDAGETDEKKTTDGRNDDGIWRPFHLLGSSRLVSSFIAIAIFGASTFLCVAGIISAAFGIRDDYATGAVGRPFSCSVA